jgi:hypothetical protein
MDQPDQRLIDHITYLASLVSSKEAIDADLDELRVLTSRYKPGQSLSVAEIDKLQALRGRLEHHLIDEDPVRAFTKEGLEQEITRHFGGIRHRPIWSLIFIILGAAMLASLPFIIPNRLAEDIKTQLALSLFFFGTHCGNIWFFMAALRNFRKELRVAFGFLATGVLLVGIVGAQFTLIHLFGFSDLPWIDYGGFLFLFPITYIPLLIGIYLFAKQLKVQSRVMSLKTLGVICVVAAVLVVLMPHKAASGEYGYYLASTLGISLGGILIGWTAAIAYAGARQLTPQYARALKLLAHAFAIICVSAIALVFALVGMGHLTPAAMTIALSPILIAEPLELLAGYTFKKRASE